MWWSVSSGAPVAWGARLAVLSLVVLSLGVPGCTGQPTADGSGEVAASDQTRPSIVLISIDTLRSDRLPAYGYDRVSTPAIDDLASDSILFERAYSPVPLTLPAHASLFTGLLPAEHGVRANSGYTLGEHATLAESLLENGYRTAGFVSSYVLRSATGIARGFERYGETEPPAERQTLAQAERPGELAIAEAIAWLGEVPSGQPFFLFVHLYEPHSPYLPPERFARLYDDPYDGEVAAADALVGQLVGALRSRKLYDEAAVILVSDHGESLGQHGEEEHGVLLYREAIQVPLLAKLPRGAESGARIDGAVSLNDVHPTVEEIAGGAAREGSLLRHLESPIRKPVISETFYPELRLGMKGLVSVIDGSDHYIEGRYAELFDLEIDPDELDDLSSQRGQRVRELRRLRQEYDTTLQPPQSTSKIDRETLERLGYLSSSTRGGGDLPDPRDEIGALEPLQSAIEMLRTGELDRAADLLSGITDRHPAFLEAWEFLAAAESERGNHQEAYEAFREAMSLGGGDWLSAPIARLAVHLGKLDEAFVMLPIALEINPEDTNLRTLRTRTLLLLDRADEALASAEDNLRSFPERSDFLYQRAAVHLGRRSFDLAERDLREVLLRSPDFVPALHDLSMLFGSQQNWTEAEPLLERLSALQPENREVARMLATVRQQLGGS